MVQNNLIPRAAALDVTVAQAQLAQARGGPRRSALRRLHPDAGTVRPSLSSPNPFCPTPPILTVTLPTPNPGLMVLRVGVQYPRIQAPGSNPRSRLARQPSARLAGGAGATQWRFPVEVRGNI